MDLSIGCDHPVRVAGMCAVCGIAVDDSSYDSNDSSAQLHDISGVQINTAEAEKLDSESTKYLLSRRRLALIVDLDQTIIHATVDPTVGDWKNDARNPNYDALLSVGKFRLGTDGKAINDDNSEEKGSTEEASRSQQQDEGCWYYVKPRPGLEQFLTYLSAKYEMYVYTMGTRSYAECVCKLVDPKGTIFGARILSRDENGSLLQKSLKKLFPMDTSMVVIIDDRADVWQWSPNLVKVNPFDFFVGIGDINASFLPVPSSSTVPPTDGETDAKELPDGESALKKDEEEKGKLQDGTTESNDGSEAAKNEAEATAVAEKQQRSTVSEQLDSRPLAKMQEALNVKNDEEQSPQARSDAAVLHDDDNELDRLKEILDQIHSRWYRIWDMTASQENKPATKTIIASLKWRVLSHCTIVFSSVIPLQQRLETSDLWRLASEFGATCKSEIDDTVTHVIAAKADTHKVLLAHKKSIPVVWPTWLHASCAAWYRQPEESYALPITNTAGLTEIEVGQISSESDALFTSHETDLPEEEEDNDDDEEEQGFGEMNWDEANDEVDAVLDGLTDDEDTTDEGGYTTDGSITKQRKRNLSARSSNADESDLFEGAEKDGDKEGKAATLLSPLSKRRKIAEKRIGQSMLKNVVPVDEEEIKLTKEIKESNDLDQKNEADGGDETDDDFLQSLQDELELQLAGSGGEEDDEVQQEEGLATDDE